MNSRTQEILNYMADLFRQGITVENLDPREAEELVRALKNSGYAPAYEWWKRHRPRFAIKPYQRPSHAPPPVEGSAATPVPSVSTGNARLPLATSALSDGSGRTAEAMDVGFDPKVGIARRPLKRGSFAMYRGAQTSPMPKPMRSYRPEFRYTNGAISDRQRTGPVFRTFTPDGQQQMVWQRPANTRFYALVPRPRQPMIVDNVDVSSPAPMSEPNRFIRTTPTVDDMTRGSVNPKVPGGRAPDLRGAGLGGDGGSESSAAPDLRDVPGGRAPDLRGAGLGGDGGSESSAAPDLRDLYSGRDRVEEAGRQADMEHAASFDADKPMKRRRGGINDLDAVNMGIQRAGLQGMRNALEELPRLPRRDPPDVPIGPVGRGSGVNDLDMVNMGMVSGGARPVPDLIDLNAASAQRRDSDAPIARRGRMVGSPDNATMSTPLREYMRLPSAYDDLSGSGRVPSPGEQREQIVDAYKKRPVDTIGVLEEIGRIPRPAAPVGGGSLPGSLEVSNLVRPRLQDQRNALQELSSSSASQERSAIDDLNALEQELEQEKQERKKRQRVRVEPLEEETRRVMAMEEERVRPRVTLQEESRRVRAEEEERPAARRRRPQLLVNPTSPDRPAPAKPAAREGGLEPYAVLDEYDQSDRELREQRLAEEEETRTRRRPLGLQDRDERRRFKPPATPERRPPTRAAAGAGRRVYSPSSGTMVNLGARSEAPAAKAAAKPAAAARPTAVVPIPRPVLKKAAAKRQ